MAESELRAAPVAIGSAEGDDVSEGDRLVGGGGGVLRPDAPEEDLEDQGEAREPRGLRPDSVLWRRTLCLAVLSAVMSVAVVCALAVAIWPRAARAAGNGSIQAEVHFVTDSPAKAWKAAKAAQVAAFEEASHGAGSPATPSGVPPSSMIPTVAATPSGVSPSSMIPTVSPTTVVAVEEDGSCHPDKTEKLIFVNSIYPQHTFNGSVLMECSKPCRFSNNKDDFKDADAVVWNARWMKPMGNAPSPSSKKACQRWVFNFYYESAIYQGSKPGWGTIKNIASATDWTMTYRLDSDFFQPMYRIGPHDMASPYPRRVSELGKVPVDGKAGFATMVTESGAASLRWFNESGSSSLRRLNESGSSSVRRSLGTNKPELLVWLVSNCKGDRKDYFNKLKGFLPKERVHIYGRCGQQMPCPKKTKNMEDPDPCEEEFFGRFKFYAAFENSRCSGYVTEKFARGLRFGMVPIVVGGKSRADYEAIAPKDAFIHVDDFKSTKALADHLLLLDRDDEAYNRMFAWRSKVYLWPTSRNRLQPFCELCEELHKPRKQQKKSIGNKLISWWYDNACLSRAFPSRALTLSCVYGVLPCIALQISIVL